MKKLILSLSAVLLIATAANAQRHFEKKDWFLGAKTTSLGLTHTFLDGQSITTFELQGAGGYFLSNRFAIDAAVGAAMVSIKDFDSTSAVVFGVGLRYYPVSNLFARAAFQGEVAGDTTATFLGVEVGYDLFVSEKVFFEPSVFYLKGLGEEDKTNNLGLAISVGVKF